MKNIEKSYEIIYKTRHDQAYASLLMQNASDDYNMGLMTQLVYGTLRNYRLVRAEWSRFVDGSLSDEVSVLMDLGVYMILFIENTPHYAIVNNIVEISKRLEYGKYTKLVNAVLKRVIKEDRLVFDDSLESLSIKYSNPLWLTKMWNAHYGYDKTLALLKYNLRENSVTLRVNVHLISVEDLLKDPRFKRGVMSPEEVYYDGNIFETDYFKKGFVSIQDAASQRVAHIVNAKASDKVLDACSAPGTKALHIASLRHDEGIIDAVELHDSRAQLIKQASRQLQLQSVNVYTQDARYLEDILELASYDKVLLDVPCTGFGVMRSKPEIKINTTGEDIDSIVEIQREIIDSAVKMVKAGGALIYSTCTLNKKENEGQIKYLLENYPQFELQEEETVFGYENDSDSFYTARLKKLK